MTAQVGDRLYVVTGYGIAAAVDPAEGTTIWQHDPQSYGHGRPTNHGFTHKGPSFWRDPERPESPARLIYASTDAILRAVYADEGTPVRSDDQQPGSSGPSTPSPRRASSGPTPRRTSPGGSPAAPTSGA